MLKIKNISANKLSQQVSQGIAKYRTAIDIEDLLRWTYQDQAADEVARKGPADLYPAKCRSNLLTIERNGLLGAKIDCAGPAMRGRGDMHPDAEAVHDAVGTLKPLWRGLVTSYAKAGGRPGWMQGEEPRPVPVLRSNGKPQMKYRDLEKTKPVYCLVRYDPDPEHLDFLRSVYTEWWAAMAALVSKLQDLGDYEVTGPVAAREPWL